MVSTRTPRSRRLRIASGGLLLLLLLGGAIYWHVTSYGYDDLTAGLRRAGATVGPGDPVYQPPFHAPGRAVTVNGADVLVYDYPLPPLVAVDAARITPDGQLGNTDWVAPPHFYRKGRLLVQYAGFDARTVSLLSAVLGPPFAEAPIAAGAAGHAPVLRR